MKGMALADSQTALDLAVSGPIGRREDASSCGESLMEHVEDGIVHRNCMPGCGLWKFVRSQMAGDNYIYIYVSGRRFEWCFPITIARH